MATRRPTAGSPLVIRHQDYSRMLDAADYYAQHQDFGRGGIPRGGRSGLVKLRNDSGGDRELGDVMEIGDLIVEDIATYQRVPWFVGIIPTYPGRSVAVYQEAVPDGDIGLAKVSGMAVAKVNLSSSTHYRAKPAKDSHSFTSGTTGPTQVEYRPSGSGVKLCWVNLSPRGNFVVAQAPGGGIAARSGSTPGSATCDLLHLVSGSITDALDDDGTTTLTETLYNLSSSAVAADAYVMFKVDCDGTAWVDFEDCG